MARKGFLLWHYYEKGKLVGFSTTHFTDDDENRLAGYFKTLSEEHKEDKCKDKVAILHQIVFLP